MKVNLTICETKEIEIDDKFLSLGEEHRKGLSQKDIQNLQDEMYKYLRNNFGIVPKNILSIYHSHEEIF